MKIKNKRTVALVTGALLLGGFAAPIGQAAAANGKALLLGTTNYATSGTWISRSNGTPLGLKGSTSVPPMVVNSSKTVTHLSADMVDGISSGSFARTSGKTGTVIADEVGVPAGCPGGTVATGGGGLADGGLQYSGPGIGDDGFLANTWYAIGYDSEWGNALSFVQCYSPTGKAVAGAVMQGGVTNPALNKVQRQGLARMQHLSKPASK